LRPGNDDVILAARERRMSVFERAAGGRTSTPQHRQHEEPDAPVAAEAPDHTGDVHFLEISEGELAPHSFEIGVEGAKIGRTAPADIVLPDKSVSREHCMIGLANDEILVTDLNSTNGTYIDGERIRRATILPVGSVLQVGHVSLRHEIRSHDEAAGQSNASSGKRAGFGGRFALSS
jgi:hypothetical protein